MQYMVDTYIPNLHVGVIKLMICYIVVEKIIFLLDQSEIG